MISPPPLYYHPSRWAIIDDQAKFLRDLESRVPDRQLYQTYSDPLKAVSELNSTYNKDRLFPDNLINDAGSDQDRAMFAVNTDRIDLQILSPERLKKFSVVISDYLMPTLNGLELFAELQDPNIKKILLTGAADEKLAVEAFNSGIIDRFVLKSHPLAIKRVWDYAKELQHDYLYSVQRTILRTLEKTSNFLSQPATDILLEELLSAENYVEYFYAHSPPGYLALKDDGSCDRILIFNDKDVEATIDYAKEHNAPESIVDLIKSKKVLAYFFEDAENFDVDEYDWSNYLVAAKSLNNSDGLLHGIYHSPPLDADYEASISSFMSVYQETTI